jgi:transporter family protein
MPASWITLSLGYVVVVGVLGITTKLALRGLNWPAIIVCTASVYAAAAIVLLARGGLRTEQGAPLLFGIVTGVLACAALVLLFIALTSGPATRVVPLTSAYPVVTVVLGVMVLSEPLTFRTVLGAAFVVTGVVVLTS